MKFDNIIIGSGLSGLTCGIALARAGRRTAIVAGGQNTLHFFGGSIELLGTLDGHDVERPLEVIDALPAAHPYRKMGAQRVAELAQQAQNLLADAGLPTTGTAGRNHYRITPMGVLKPAWLTLRDVATTDKPDGLPWRSVCLVNLDGFIDYPIDFVADGLRRLGAEVDTPTVSIDALRRARRSATEMRATSLARVLNNTTVVEQLAAEISRCAGRAQVVLMPAVLGFDNDDVCWLLMQRVGRPLQFLATLPPSVTGVRVNAALRHYYQMLGGRLLAGDTAAQITRQGNRITGVRTAKLQALTLQAESYVMATGSFVSRGLTSNFERIAEPLLGLDVDITGEHEQWTRYGVMEQQPYMSTGVVTDGNFHPLCGGEPLSNAYAIGQLLGGHDPVASGDGTGVSLLTALAVANDILN